MLQPNSSGLASDAEGTLYFARGAQLWRLR
jgi:hypothetical protein